MISNASNLFLLGLEPGTIIDPLFRNDMRCLNAIVDIQQILTRVFEKVRYKFVCNTVWDRADLLFISSVTDVDCDY